MQVYSPEHEEKKFTHRHFFMRAEEISGLSEGVPEVCTGDEGRQEAGCGAAHPGIVVAQEIGLHPYVHLTEDPLTGQSIAGHLGCHPLQTRLGTALGQLRKTRISKHCIYTCIHRIICILKLADKNISIISMLSKLIFTKYNIYKVSIKF